MAIAAVQTRLPTKMPACCNVTTMTKASMLTEAQAHNRWNGADSAAATGGMERSIAMASPRRSLRARSSHILQPFVGIAEAWRRPPSAVRPRDMLCHRRPAPVRVRRCLGHWALRSWHRLRHWRVALCRKLWRVLGEQWLGERRGRRLGLRGACSCGCLGARRRWGRLRISRCALCPGAGAVFVIINAALDDAKVGARGADSLREQNGPGFSGGDVELGPGERRPPARKPVATICDGVRGAFSPSRMRSSRGRSR